jgi:tetratricopeptide (TPR) repeat protein
MEGFPLSESVIVGRDRELREIAGVLDHAAEGRGSIWYVTGEPGIGKSRLAEEIAQRARQRGFRAYWGRCWEAGGAPAYWPWMQVLRALLRTMDPGEIGPHGEPIAQILPELRPLEPAGTSSLEPEQARFRLMDAMGAVIADAARHCPLVIVLEDLHAADVSSVLLLEFLAATVRHQPLLILGTFRDAELAAAPAGSQLIRAAQEGHRLSLQRLSESDVGLFLKATGESADAEFVAALHRTTDGQPLFLAEITRLWRSQGSRKSIDHLSIPRSVRTAIGERLARVSPSCVHVLRRGAVVGREFDIGLLAAAYQDDPNDYVAACQEATECAILAETGPQRYRFLHFLIRQHVYEGIAEQERADAHARLARALEARPLGEEARWSEVAHHLVAAGRCREAATAYRKAGAEALQQLAFEEAAQSFGEALRAARTAGTLDPEAHVELLLDLAHAQTQAGELASGKQTSTAAADLARRLGSAELLARAALEHGAALIHAKVDRELVGLLQEALDALDPTDSALRARVMARLAAAMQPATDPEGPIELAREAIGMARRLGDRVTLLDTLRNGGSAMVDLGDLEERLALDREHATLAEELDEPVEALRGNMRSIMDYLELGRLDDAYRAMRACERITERLDHPAYRWRSTALQALRAIWEGDFVDAERLVEAVRSLGKSGRDPNAAVVYAAQRVRLHQLRGEFEAQIPLLPTLDGHWDDTELGRATAQITVGAEHLLAGRTSQALRGFDAERIERLLRLGDHTLKLNVARLAVAAQDRGLAERLYRRLLPIRDRLVTGGVLYMTLEGPTSWALASTARFLGRKAEAREHYEHALDITRRLGGRPVHALIAHEYADFLAEHDENDVRRRALESAQSAQATAQELGMHALLADCTELLSRLRGASKEIEPSVSEGGELTMDHIGDTWLIRYADSEFHLKDLRGVRLLATLVAEPGREFHVLDLDRENVAPTARVDARGAIAALDEEARRQYGARIAELKEEIEEADAWNDPERGERARRELAFIEQELSRALGLGGRPRQQGSAAERARVNVQRRIRDAIRRIEEHHAALAKHLDRAVRTGMYCAYEP